MLAKLFASARRAWRVLGQRVGQESEVVPTSILKEVERELQVWRHGFVPPGHFYSPLPDFRAVQTLDLQNTDWNRKLPGLDLCDEAHLQLFDCFVSTYPELPFPEKQAASARYYLDNDFFPYADGIVLYSMLRLLKPKRFVEVGSGYSSCAALDTAERFLAPHPEFVFIDPYPERLNALLGEYRCESPVTVLAKPVQHVDRALFENLEHGDILFVDSSHVSKIGSDVNFIVFEVLPRLRPGVVVHFHDIFYPFEYPAAWITEGRAWNEAYLLRAFLTLNPHFRVLFFSSYFLGKYRDRVAAQTPLMLRIPTNPSSIPGGSLWIAVGGELPTRRQH